MPVADASDVVVSGGADGMARAVREAALHVLRGERRRARLAVTFVGKTRMQHLNAHFLGHDYVTDVISFPLPQADKSTVADLYVCRYSAARYARSHGVPVREELLRLVVHGTLHVLGWDHPTGGARLRSPMWRRQERYVSTLR